MRSRWNVSGFVAALAVFWVTVSWAQAPPTLQPRPAPPQQTSGTTGPVAGTQSNVAPTAPVITLQGVCENPPTTAVQKAADCTTVITRADFEKLVEAVDPTMAAPARRTLAENYAKIAVMATDARNHGMEDDTKTQQVLRFVRLQALANLNNQQMQRKAMESPPQEVENYYKAHESNFEEATLRRIYITKSVPEGAKKLSDAERTMLAAALYKRAVAGEDFDKLQQEAYTTLEIKGQPPPTSMGPQRRGAMPPLQEGAVFGLKPGEISPVLSDNIADYIYKLESKRTVPLETVRVEIQRTLAGARYQEAIGKVFASASVQLNPEYFGSGAAIALPGKPAAAEALKPTPPQPKQ
jgi:hypothetical protein